MEDVAVEGSLGRLPRTMHRLEEVKGNRCSVVWYGIFLAGEVQRVPKKAELTTVNQVVRSARTPLRRHSDSSSFFCRGEQVLLGRWLMCRH